MSNLQPVNMVKVPKINLEKSAKKREETLDLAVVGLGWDPINTKEAIDAGIKFDLDASIYAKKDGILVDYGYFNKPEALDKLIELGEDSLDGEGEGDDESIKIRLKEIKERGLADELIILVNIFKEKKTKDDFGGDEEALEEYNRIIEKQVFGVVENSYCRLLANDKEIATYDLQEDGEDKDSVTLFKLYIEDDSWKAEAIEEYHNMDISQFINSMK